LIAAAGIVVGCDQQKAATVDPNAFPADYKKEILALIPTLVSDPTNIRDAGITDPVLLPVAGTPRYITCVRFNPRNENHDYIGIVERVGYFYGGHLNQFVKAGPDECKAAAYKPFPELEKICLGKSCT
jgi:hypothetical protein